MVKEVCSFAGFIPLKVTIFRLGSAVIGTYHEVHDHT